MFFVVYGLVLGTALVWALHGREPFSTILTICNVLHGAILGHMVQASLRRWLTDRRERAEWRESRMAKWRAEGKIK